MFVSDAVRAGLGRSRPAIRADPSRDNLLVPNPISLDQIKIFLEQIPAQSFFYPFRVKYFQGRNLEKLELFRSVLGLIRVITFVVRLMQRRRSGIDGRTLARRFGCNKQGFSPNNQTNQRSSLREGCKATILVKMEKSGKWIVTRFVKEHNHSLLLTVSSYNSMDDKDDKIRELMVEVECQDRLCVAYRDKLVSFMSNVERHTEELSFKIRGIVENIKKLECEMQSYDDHL